MELLPNAGTNIDNMNMMFCLFLWVYLGDPNKPILYSQ